MVKQKIIVKQTEKGQVLILVLMMMVFLLSISLTINQAVIINSKLASDTIRSTKAIYAAEAIIEDALLQLKRNQAWTPAENPEEIMFPIEPGDNVRVKRTFSNGADGIKVTLMKGQVLQFTLAPGNYQKVAFYWADETYPPASDGSNFLYPSLDVHYSGYARYDPSSTPQITVGPSDPGVLLEEYGHALFEGTPEPSKEYQFNQEIRSDVRPQGQQTPFFDQSKRYQVRVKSFRLGTNNTIKIVPLDGAGNPVPNILQGVVSITAIGEYIPDNPQSLERGVRVSLSLPQESLYNIFDYGVYIDEPTTFLDK
jgi:hypothetical protein